MGPKFSLPTQAWSWIYLENGMPFYVHEGASNSKTMLLQTNLSCLPEVIYILILGALAAQQCQPRISLFFPIIHFFLCQQATSLGWLYLDSPDEGQHQPSHPLSLPVGE